MNINTNIISASIIAAITIAAIIFAYDDASKKWFILSFGVAIFTIDVLRGIFGKPIISGFTPVSNTKENESRYRFSRVFNFMLWLGLIAITVQLKG